jgi:para-aminobenzoate synthetase component 1
MEDFFIHLPASAERGNGCKAWGIQSEFVLTFPLSADGWEKAQSWLDQEKGNCIFSLLSYEAGFQHLGVELKNNPIQPALLFVVPKSIEWFAENESSIENHKLPSLPFIPVENEESYYQKLNTIKAHLMRGDYYETNYCTQLIAEVSELNPYQHWLNLFQSNPAPHAAYVQWKEHHLMCLSPERFIQKKGETLISQPIKGTIKKGSTSEEDQILKNQLTHSVKDNTENTMIVDLVRNDLSKIAQKGSVKVTELAHIYSFPKLHHLISTVQCQIKSEANFTSIMAAMLPMGSMTGVPKKNAVNSMHDLETNPRGWYSGTLGIILPNGDFDFNVIIRSIYWNRNTQQASIGIGGAITLHSNFKEEYQECWLKAQSLINP